MVCFCLQSTFDNSLEDHVYQHLVEEAKKEQTQKADQQDKLLQLEEWENQIKQMKKRVRSGDENIGMLPEITFITPKKRRLNEPTVESLDEDESEESK